MARLETGAVQFGNDWPGTFIRGDHAAHFAMTLDRVIKGLPAIYMNQIERSVLEGLRDTLAGSNTRHPGHKATMLKPYKECLPDG